jgi:hypothetical protein
MDKADLRVDWATHAAAKHAVENWHYSACMPSSKLVKVGVWERDKFVGVVVFGSGATPNLGRPYGLRQDACSELVRVALTSHESAVSRIVAISLRFLRNFSPKLRLVVSFADVSQGHHGGIYQAGGWIYSGPSNSDKFFMINGKLTHRRTLGSAGLKQNLTGARARDANAEAVIVPGKHRYLMPLDADMRKSIMHLSKPYPKRVKQATTDDQSAGRRGGTDPHAPQEADNGRS